MKNGKKFCLSVSGKRKRKWQDKDDAFSKSEGDSNEGSSGDTNRVSSTVGEFSIPGDGCQPGNLLEAGCDVGKNSSSTSCGSSLHCTASSRDQQSFAKSRDILSWIKHPSNPKTVACPACGRAVLMCDINRHLDSDCSLHIASKNIAEGLNDPEGVISCKGRGTGKHFQVPNLEPEDKSLDENVRYFSEVVPLMGQDNSEGKNNSQIEAKETGTGSNYDISSIMETTTREPHCTEVHVVQDSSQRPYPNSAENNNTKRTDAKEDPGPAGENLNQHEPYYLANFKLVLSTVLSNAEDMKLFNSEDKHIIDSFNSLSTEEQKLYIRLFQRKYGWFRCSKLDYQEISHDLVPVISGLKEKGTCLQYLYILYTSLTTLIYENYLVLATTLKPEQLIKEKLLLIPIYNQHVCTLWRNW